MSGFGMNCFLSDKSQIAVLYILPKCLLGSYGGVVFISVVSCLLFCWLKLFNAQFCFVSRFPAKGGGMAKILELEMPEFLITICTKCNANNITTTTAETGSFLKFC